MTATTPATRTSPRPVRIAIQRWRHHLRKKNRRRLLHPRRSRRRTRSRRRPRPRSDCPQVKQFFFNLYYSYSGICIWYMYVPYSYIHIYILWLLYLYIIIRIWYIYVPCSYIAIYILWLLFYLIVLLCRTDRRFIWG